MIDITQQINAVSRRVGDRVIAAGPTRTVTISQTYRASIEDVWDACTNPERLPRWFLPVSGDLRLHGKYQLEGNAEGTIEACDPPRSFAATWEYGGVVSWIEVNLTSEAPERTRLELTHLATPDENWDQFGPGAGGIGWDLGLLALTLHLDSGETVDSAAVQAWLTSPEGQEFMRLSGEGWYEAEVAAGADAAVARARADRTLTSYTGAEATEGSAAGESQDR